MLDNAIEKKPSWMVLGLMHLKRMLNANIFSQAKARGVMIQGLVLSLVLLGLYYLFSNATQNLNQMGMMFGFDFLNATAGFNISWSLLAYDPTMNYWRVFMVGMINTLILSFSVIVVATILGTLIGIMRLSSNPMVAFVARAYVELVRNIPLLIQIIFWFTVVFSTLPSPRQSYVLLDAVVLNNRGLYLPSFELTEQSILPLIMVLVSLVLVFFVNRKSKIMRRKLGEVSYYIKLLKVCTLSLLALFIYQFNQYLNWQIPELKGFNYDGGVFLPAAFGAAFIAMTIYRSASIAETVRAGIQSIDKGQAEAASTIGFSRFQALKLIIIPQAARAIVPPITNAWLATTKDSSLAVAIGFPELVSLFMQTSINQTGRAIEIIAMVMGFYVVVSLLMSYLLNVYNNRVQLKVR